VEDAFGVVIFVVVGLAILVALLVFARGGDSHAHIGKGGLSLDRDDDHGRRPTHSAGSPAALAERDAEVRQMLAARNARRVARGEEPLDVEAELVRLTAPAEVRVDPALVAEIRQMVVARNARRERRGEEPLDVDAEVARQVRELGG